MEKEISMKVSKARIAEMSRDLDTVATDCATATIKKVIREKREAAANSVKSRKRPR